MAWTTPRTWSSNEIVTAALLNTHVRDNLGYLISRSNNLVLRNNGSDYTTTSSAFPAIDSTNLSITLTMTTTKVLLILLGTASNSGTGNETDFDFTVDGTRVGTANTRGLAGFYAPVLNYFVSVCVVTIATVSTGSRVFKPVWAARAGTSTFYSTTGNTPSFFAAIEVA